MTRLEQLYKTKTGSKIDVYASGVWKAENKIISALQYIDKNYDNGLLSGVEFIRYSFGNIYTHPYKKELIRHLKQYIDSD